MIPDRPFTAPLLILGGFPTLRRRAWGSLGRALGLSWVFLGLSGAPLCPSRGRLEPVLGVSWSVWGAFLSVLWSSWALFCLIWESLGPFLVVFRSSLGFGPVLVRSGALRDAPGISGCAFRPIGVTKIIDFLQLLV